ncbi:hypothetical protein PORY_001153 [Pneumocystis oryctolagi]|uniref:Uncharacterized protein n=1 Tax=Pneumocystis oryctolagi TaxID=42067 RepID=A0ACB7CCW2_9ASCO|nr:hypothetical protein PORY_001153 [Pneumocystis oryctolagi]
MSKVYPRRTLKAILKAHTPQCRLAKNVDVLVYLDYLLFLSTLVRVATTQARQTREKTLRAASIQKTVQFDAQQAVDRYRRKYGSVDGWLSEHVSQPSGWNDRPLGGRTWGRRLGRVDDIRVPPCGSCCGGS